jgi:hypothetical protein
VVKSRHVVVKYKYDLLHKVTYRQVVPAWPHVHLSYGVKVAAGMYVHREPFCLVLHACVKWPSLGPLANGVVVHVVNREQGSQCPAVL